MTARAWGDHVLEARLLGGRSGARDGLAVMAVSCAACGCSASSPFSRRAEGGMAGAAYGAAGLFRDRFSPSCEEARLLRQAREVMER